MKAKTAMTHKLAGISYSKQKRANPGHLATRAIRVLSEQQFWVLRSKEKIFPL